MDVHGRDRGRGSPLPPDRVDQPVARQRPRGPEQDHEDRALTSRGHLDGHPVALHHQRAEHTEVEHGADCVSAE